MARTDQHHKDGSFSFRVAPDLKAAFQNAAKAQDKPAAELLRNLMQAYVRRQEFVPEATRQSRIAAALAEDPDSDENEVMRWIENVSDTTGWTA